jgi:hypothetical protein
MKFTMAERKKIRAEYAVKYRKAKKAEILDKYLELIGKGNRKYAIFILNREGKKQLRFIGGKNVNMITTGNYRKKMVYNWIKAVNWYRMSIVKHAKKNGKWNDRKISKQWLIDTGWMDKLMKIQWID